MHHPLRTFALFFGLSLLLLCLSSAQLAAQQVDQEAYHAGYANGVNAARANRPMNLNTDDWHGDRLAAYQQGYQEGYRSLTDRDHHHDHDDYAGEVPERWAHDTESQRAWQAGYANGMNAGRNHQPLNMETGDWHGDRLTAYQDGYRDGYRSGRR